MKSRHSRPPREPLPPPDAQDPVVEAYKKHVDRSLLRENLRLSVEERLQKFLRNMSLVQELRAAGERLRNSKETP
jgi:hypothetical protein